MSAIVPLLQKENTKLKRQLERANDLLLIKALELDQMKKELEYEQLIHDTTFKLYVGLMNQASTVSELRKWFADLYTDMKENAGNPQAIADMLTKHGITVAPTTNDLRRGHIN